MTKMITALDTSSGQVGEVPEIYLSLPTLGDHLVRVDDGTKSYEPELFKPTDAKEYTGRKPKSKAVADEKPADAQDETLDFEIQ